MNTSTNKLKSNMQVLKKSIQPDLHLKILNIVANRMNPVVTNLNLDKRACGSCTTNAPSSNYPTKKHSLTTTRQKQTNSKCNKTASQLNLKDNFHQQIQTQIIKKQSIPIRKRRLLIIPKVISFHIEHKKLGKLTVDLRRQMNDDDFVNIKTMNKLKLQNAQKSRRIIQLQQQVLQLHQKIIELNLNLQIRSKALSDVQIQGLSINRISSVHYTNNNQSKQTTKVWIQFQPQNVYRQSQNKLREEQNKYNQYDYLLRILNTQALQIQNRIKQRELIKEQQEF